MNFQVHFLWLIPALAISCSSKSGRAEPPARGPAVTILDQTKECGGAATLELGPDGGFTLAFPNFVVTQGEAGKRARSLCLVRIQVEASSLFCVERGDFDVSGAATLMPGTKGSNISVRYSALGERGADHFRAFDPGASSGDFSATSTGSEPWFSCGREVRLSVIADVTVGPGDEHEASLSSIQIKNMKAKRLLWGCLPPSPR